MKIVIAALLLSLCAFRAGAQEIVAGSTLTLNQCISIALGNDPDIKASAFTANAQKAVLGQAKSAYYPTLNATAGYTSNHADKRNLTDTYASTIGNYDTKSAGLALNQIVYDFGKTGGSVKAGKAQARSAEFDVDNQRVETAHVIKQAYYAFAFATLGQALSDEVLAQYSKNVYFARAHFEAKISPKYDVTKAEADYSSAKLNNIKARNDVQLSRAYLINSMNLLTAPEFSIESSTEFVKYPVEMDEVVSAAYASKPDLLSAMAQVDALSAQVSAAKGGYFPTLSASAGYNFLGTRSPLSQGWNAGVSMSANIFSGFVTKEKVSEQENRLAAMRAKVESLKLSIYLDAKQAYLNLLKYEQAVATSIDQVQQATENLEIASLRYQTGLGSPMEISDATVLYNNSKGSLLNSLYNYKLAEAEIEKIKGSKQ